MADREVTGWITVNGIHIPIYDGQSKSDAVNSYIAKKNEETKVKQIKANKKQADKLNNTMAVYRVDKNAALQPDSETDLNDIMKNPIPFVGVGKDQQIGTLIDGQDVIQSKFIANYDIDISKVQTLQSFVLKSGITDYKSWDNSEKPYVVEFEGNYYLLDGNHRMAKALLDGKKTMNVELSKRVRKS